MLRCLSLVLVLLVACSREKRASSGEERAGEPLGLVFRNIAYGVNPGGLDPETAPVTVASQPGALVVHDRLEKGVCHTEENQHAFLRGDTITLELAYPYKTGACAAVAEISAYEATIYGLPRGAYLFQVKTVGDVSTTHAERGPQHIAVP